MRQHLIAYPVWFKPDAIEWMCQGLADTMDPARVQILFFFDGADPESMNAFAQCAPTILRGFRYTTDACDTPIYENGCTRHIIERHFLPGWCDTLVVPHDDNRFTGTSFLDDLDIALDSLGPQAGYIGCRDAYNLRYADFISSPFSGSDKASAKLEVGKFAPRTLINTGPVIYPRHLVSAIGNLNPDYKAWYWWDDYALLAQHRGFRNGLLSISALHHKLGRCPPSELYIDRQGWVAKDLALLNERWRPHFGGNVI